MPINTEVTLLKEMARTKYHEDMGVMYETSTHEDYVRLIEHHGTAARAWRRELELLDVRKEVSGYFEHY